MSLLSAIRGRHLRPDGNGQTIQQEPGVVSRGTVRLPPGYMKKKLANRNGDEIPTSMALQTNNPTLPAPVNDFDSELDDLTMDSGTYPSELLEQPVYEDQTLQALNDIAADESFPVMVEFIENLSRLGARSRGRLILRAAAFQSKNYVFSNIIDANDYRAAQDDFEFAQMWARSDLTTFDTSADFFTAEAVMEAQNNIRLRRSRKGMNLLQINTRRNESYMEQGMREDREQRGIRSRLPIIGSL